MPIMKSTLEFDLSDGDDREYFSIYTKAPEFYSSLCSIKEFIRKQLKHNNELTEAEEDLLQSIKNLLPENLED